MKKQCRICGAEFYLSEFYRNKATTDGRQSYCKECDKKVSKEYYKNNLERCREKRKKWMKANYKKRGTRK